MSEKYLRTSELARAIGYSRERVARMAAKNEIPEVMPRKPGESFRFHLTPQLEAWITKRRATKGLNAWNELTTDELTELGLLRSFVDGIESQFPAIGYWKHAKLKAFQALLQRARRIERYIAITLDARHRHAKRQRAAEKRKSKQCGDAGAST